MIESIWNLSNRVGSWQFENCFNHLMTLCRYCRILYVDNYFPEEVCFEKANTCFLKSHWHTLSSFVVYFRSWNECRGPLPTVWPCEMWRGIGPAFLEVSYYQLKMLFIVRQFLFVSISGNVRRTEWRVCILMFGCKGTSIPCKRPGNECGFIHVATAFLFGSSALLHNLNTDSKVQIEVFFKVE